MSDYLLHLEIGDAANPPHGTLKGYDAAEIYAEIASALARRTIASSKATITTIVKRPDGRVIMLRRAWSDDDFGESEQPASEANQDIEA